MKKTTHTYMQFIPFWPSYAICWYRTVSVLVLVVIFAWGNQSITCTNVGLSPVGYLR